MGHGAARDPGYDGLVGLAQRVSTPADVSTLKTPPPPSTGGPLASHPVCQRVEKHRA